MRESIRSEGVGQGCIVGWEHKGPPRRGWAKSLSRRSIAQRVGGKDPFLASWSLGATLTRLQDPGPHCRRRHHRRHGSELSLLRFPSLCGLCLPGSTAAKPRPPACQTSSLEDKTASSSQSLTGTPDSTSHFQSCGNMIGQEENGSRLLPPQPILLVKIGRRP